MLPGEHEPEQPDLPTGEEVSGSACGPAARAEPLTKEDVMQQSLPGVSPEPDVGATERAIH